MSDQMRDEMKLNFMAGQLGYYAGRRISQWGAIKPPTSFYSY